MSVMDYLQMLKEQPQEKLALVEDREAYTYARLVQEAQELRAALAYSEPAVFIHEDSIARQLVRFLAYSGTRTVPIIATEVSRTQQFDVGAIPEAAAQARVSFCGAAITAGQTFFRSRTAFLV